MRKRTTIWQMSRQECESTQPSQPHGDSPTIRARYVLEHTSSHQHIITSSCLLYVFTSSRQTCLFHPFCQKTNGHAAARVRQCPTPSCAIRVGLQRKEVHKQIYRNMLYSIDCTSGNGKIISPKIGSFGSEYTCVNTSQTLVVC